MPSSAKAHAASGFPGMLGRLFRSPLPWLTLGGVAGMLTRSAPVKRLLARWFDHESAAPAFVDAGSIDSETRSLHDILPWGDSTDGSSVHVVVAVPRSALREALNAAFPARIAIGDGWVELRRLDAIRYDPGHGVRAVCAARVHYPIAVLPDDFTIEEAVVDVVPQIVDGPDGPVLAFALDIADFDVKYLPAFIDRAIASKLNRALQERLANIAWNLSHSLNRVVDLPQRVALLRQLALGPTSATVAVTNEGIVLRLVIPVRFIHTAV